MNRCIAFWLQFGEAVVPETTAVASLKRKKKAQSLRSKVLTLSFSALLDSLCCSESIECIDRKF